MGGSYKAALQKEFINSCRRKATRRAAPGEEIVEGIILEIFQKGYKSEKSAQYVMVGINKPNS